MKKYSRQRDVSIELVIGTTNKKIIGNWIKYIAFAICEIFILYCGISIVINELKK